MRRSQPFALAVAAILLFACGDGPAEPTPTPEPPAGTPEPVEGLPVLGQATQDLQFLGPTESLMSDAQVSCAWTRGSTPDSGRLLLAFSGAVGGERHTLRVVVNGYSGPGSYAWEGAGDPRPQVTAEVDSSLRGHVTINVDPPGSTGDMEVTLTSPLQGRIYGIWECPGIPR
jgi:hypothetical protein